MQAFIDLWKGFRLLPSAWLLLMQLFILVLSLLSHHATYRVLIWMLGVVVLLLIAKVIRQTPMFTFLGLSFVTGALFFSLLIVLGVNNPTVLVISHAFEAAAYLSAAYGLLRYMFEDRYLTRDELFAAGAVFTLIAWAFAFVYNICQILDPSSFYHPTQPDLQSWLDLLFLSFSLQSATGLSDLMPIGPAVRVIAMLQMFCGVMYLALIVSRLIALQYIRHLPRNKD
ncbi:two pore domain potassium channel family protein [Acinetobacter indicus]|uniref:ion channel n=1 Tax=Acinetobacter indicus TaxID=756892 RepID=UPI002574907A|nr:ion channel [Acinetobacter indicus]MDM1278014.1 two pore domain potassium channel family protein [Acinetobacter indicus]